MNNQPFGAAATPYSRKFRPLRLRNDHREQLRFFNGEDWKWEGVFRTRGDRSEVVAMVKRQILYSRCV